MNITPRLVTLTALTALAVFTLTSEAAVQFLPGEILGAGRGLRDDLPKSVGRVVPSSPPVGVRRPMVPFCRVSASVPSAKTLTSLTLTAGPVTGAAPLNGNTVGADNILYYLIPNNASHGRMDAAGNLLGNTNIGFLGGDVVQSALDGTLWVTNEPAGTIHHFTTAGVPIGSPFASGLTGGGFYGLGIAPMG